MATQKEVAEHIDLSDRQVRTLVRNAVIPAGKGPGGYDIDSCRVAYIRYLRSLGAGKVREEAERPDEQIDYEFERARLTKEQADWQELKNAQARREVAPIQLIEWALSRVGAQIGPLLESIPQKVKRRVPSLTAAQIDIIKREVIKAQNLMARIAIDLDEYRGPGGDSDSDPSGQVLTRQPFRPGKWDTEAFTGCLLWKLPGFRNSEHDNSEEITWLRLPGIVPTATLKTVLFETLDFTIRPVPADTSLRFTAVAVMGVISPKLLPSPVRAQTIILEIFEMRQG